jgi:hypothetical protein
MVFSGISYRLAEPSANGLQRHQLTACSSVSQKLVVQHNDQILCHLFMIE